MNSDEFLLVMRTRHPALFSDDLSSDVGFEVGAGWFPLLAELLEDLQKWREQGAFWIVRVKEKFGTLRVQIAFDEDDQKLRAKVYEVLARFDERSATTCERCGSEQGVLMRQPWERVRCPRCSLFESLDKRQE